MSYENMFDPPYTDDQRIWANSRHTEYRTADQFEAAWWLALSETQRGSDATNSILMSIACSLLAVTDHLSERNELLEKTINR